MNFTYFVLFIFAVTFSKTIVEATRCKPFSTFKIDCDECRCSEDGTQYSCSAKQCLKTGSIQAPDEKNSYVLDDAPNSDEKVEFAYLNDDTNIDSEEDDDNEYDYESDENSEEAWDSGFPDGYRRKRKVRGKRYIAPHGKRHVGPVGR